MDEMEEMKQRMTKLLQALYELVKGHDAHVATTAALNLASMVAANCWGDWERQAAELGYMMHVAEKLNGGKGPLHVPRDVAREFLGPQPSDHARGTRRRPSRAS